MPTSPLQQAFEAVPEAQLLIDTQAQIVAVSDGYLQATGLTRAGVVGRTLFELSPYHGAQDASAQLAQTLEVLPRSPLAMTIHFSDTVACVTGTWFTRASSLPLIDSSGHVSHLVHRLESAPSHEGAESDRERRLRKLIEYSFDCIALFDARINFTYVTPSVERITGYTPTEWLARAPLTDVHPDDAVAAAAAARRLLEEPRGVLIHQLRLRHRDGSWRTIELIAVNHLHDADVNAAVATFRDVTERVAMADELRRSRDHLAVALSAAHAITWDRDLITGQSWFSADFAGYFGLPPGEHADFDAIHSEDRDAVARALARSQESGADFQAEFRGIERGDATRRYAARGQVVRDGDGRSVRHVGVIWDVTETYRLQKERGLLEQRMQEGQKLESLGVLAGGIAHDFNNLLMAIMGNASLMRVQANQSPVGLGYLKQIEEASLRASDLCRQMLAYAGKGRFVLERTSLNALIEEITHLLQVSISKKAVLRFHLHPKLPAIVADPTQIRQVLMNLVINASDAIGERSGMISISTGVVRADRAYLDKTFLSPELAEGDYVYLEVSDTGHGMSLETQQRIFEPFFSTKAPGRGLGLAAVLGIVRGHRGALKVYSEQDKGSSFKFLLPSAGDGVETRAKRSLLPAGTHAPHGTILVVDDEETLRAVACQMVEQLGMRALAAADGREALVVYRAHRQEIVGVIMDLTMPHMDGEESFRELRRIDPEVRVLLTSGYSEQDAVARFVGKGLAGFIQKPFGLEELEKQLGALLAGGSIER